MTSNEKYHVALSFAGEDREYVEEVAEHLSTSGVGVFYDKFEETKLWGKDLYSYLSEVYQNQAMYTVMFVSKAYGEKLWTNHERKSAQARAFTENREYILPAVFDETVEVPGLPKTTGYIKLDGVKPGELAEKIIKKLTDEGVLFKAGSSFKYAQWAKEDVDYSVSREGDVPAIIRDLKSYNWYTQNPAVLKLIALDWSELTPDEIFILGRNLYQCACGGEKKAYAMINDLRRTLAAMREEAAPHFLNGMFYELYFDSKGVFRGTKLKSRCMSGLFAIQGVEKYAPSIEFIREAIGPYRDTLSVLPSTKPEEIIVEVSIDKKDPPSITSMLCSGKEMLIRQEQTDSDTFSRAWRLSFQEFTIDELLKHLSEIWQIPMDQLIIEGGENVPKRTKLRISEDSTVGALRD